MGTATKKQNKVPELRFSGFGNEWKQDNLGNVADFWNGKAHEQVIDENGQYVVINSKFVSTEGSVRKYSNQLISPLSKHDVVLVMSDIPNGKALGKCFLVDEDEKYTLNQRIGGIRSKDIVSSFLCTIVNRHKYFLSFNNGVSQTNLRKDEVLGCPLIFPDVSEQQKIADFLGSVDDWLDNLRGQKTALETYKRGMMQKLFTQKIRFKDADGKDFPEWAEGLLSTIGKTYNGLAGKSGEDFGEGDPFITYKQIFDDSEVDKTRFQKVCVRAGEKQNKAQYGDTFFTTSSETPNEVGYSSVLLEKGVAPYLNSFSFAFRPNSLNELSPSFAKYLFRSDSFRKDVVKLAQGSTRYNISKIGFMKISIHLPVEEEQQKIADFLTSLDKSIESKQQQIAKAEEWKKGLMQKMFV